MVPGDAGIEIIKTYKYESQYLMPPATVEEAIALTADFVVRYWPAIAWHGRIPWGTLPA